MTALFESYNDLLKCIARLTGGYAAVASQDGFLIKAFNSEGQEVEELAGSFSPLARKAADTGKPQAGFSETVEGAEEWAIAAGKFVFLANNQERHDRDRQLFQSLTEALPFIARVAGGEAVLFDKDGKRLAIIGPTGISNDQFLGKVSMKAQTAMATQKTVIGESTSVQGAMAVRVPITKEFGLGFNNELQIAKEQRLYEEVKKFQYARYNFEDIIGESEAIKKVKSMASFIASGVSSVLIFGETGTGKELFAQAIHNASPRRSKPFVAINCGALPASIIESVLFGYEGGAFTGAKKEGQMGSFEQANGGSIFLDEISEMDFNLQNKLLRVLQEREVTRIGGRNPIKLDVRVIASTNKKLHELVREGKFREDLYYRINVVELKIPALRERKEDINLLVKSFVDRFNKVLGKYIYGLSEDAAQILRDYSWPGNVRELQNVIESAMNMVARDDKYIGVEHLPLDFREISPENRERHMMLCLEDALSRTEKETIQKALNLSNGVKTEAARLLNISTITLWRKIKQYNI